MTAGRAWQAGGLPIGSWDPNRAIDKLHHTSQQSVMSTQLLHEDSQRYADTSLQHATNTLPASNWSSLTVAVIIQSQQQPQQQPVAITTLWSTGAASAAGELVPPSNDGSQ